METVLLGQSGEHKDGVIRINYKSDFPLGIRLLKEGQVAAFPDCDFTLKATTESGFKVFKAGRKNGVYTHCKVSNNQLVVFFDNHNLGKGHLKIELFIDYPDDDYTDGYRRECFSGLSNIELVGDNGDTLNLGMPDPVVVEKEVIKEKKSILVWQI